MKLIHAFLVFCASILTIFSLFMIFVYYSGDQMMSVSTLETQTDNHVLSSERLKQKGEKQSIRRHHKRDISALNNDLNALDSNTHFKSNGSVVGSDGLPVKGYTCKSINVRNNVSDLDGLRGCTVVEGSVMIALIESTEFTFENYTFPLLREITDYLVIFRVYSLYTLGKLFPNLTVIRGQHLFHDNALVFRNTSLKEIGLKKLKHIMRGAVRIDRNPYLCFADTIDWNVIAKNAKNSHIINNNRDNKLCPTCAKHCPMKGYRTNDGQFIGDLNGRLCWSGNMCQSVCDQSCEDTTGTCYANNASKCCDVKCLGGCNELNIKENRFKREKCDVCRFIFKNISSGAYECVKQCPTGTYEYLNRLCFTASDCVAKSEKLKNIDLKPFGGKCVRECPRGFEEQANDKNKCVPCKGISCSKKCESRELSNIATIQSMEGCTIINGNLVINIDTGGSNVIRELEKSLKHLQEIRGYLKIFHSSPIVNLNFLSNLRIVHGDALERQIYSFYVFDNSNLQDLWPERVNSNQTGLKLEFIKGKLFMHMNPRLCYSKIKELDVYAKFVSRNESSWDIHDVSADTNGDKTACNMTKLELKISETNSNSIVITFQNFNQQLNDYRKLLGYLVNYKEAPFKNVSLYEDNNPCTSTWIVKDIGSINDTVDDIMYEISSLQPFTQYVLYVKTYTTSSEDKGAQSDLIYFTTQPDTPSHPLSFEAITVSDSEIYVEWKPPSSPNGIIGYYIVNVYQFDHNYAGNMGQTRNYCQNPISFDIQRDTKFSEESKKVHLKYLLRNNLTDDSKYENNETPDNKQCCRCDTIPQIITIKNEEAERQISFENYLINAVYKKRNDTLRKKRDVSELGKYLGMSFKASHNVEINTSLIIPDLMHYTQYLIEVIACHNDLETVTEIINTIETTVTSETTTSDTNTFDTLTNLTNSEIKAKQLAILLDSKQYERCSRSTNDIAKTLPIPSADNIDESSVTHYNQNNTIIISWDEPHDPNGYIVSYNIEYQSLLRKSQSPRSCITRDDFMRNNNSYRIVDLLPGNYSYRLQANSIAGSGNWTKQYFFIVVELPTDTNWVTVFIVLAIVGCISFIGVFLYCYYHPNNELKLDYASVNPIYLPFPEIKPDPDWDVLRTQVEIISQNPIGEGKFSKVYEGLITKNKAKKKCAIKVIRDGSQSNTQFLKEAQKMKKLSDCHHVVKLLGIVTSNSWQQPILVLMEYMANRDLKKYLYKNRPENPNANPPDKDKLAQMAIEIADGMAYLEEKKCVHGDLAARNCLVSEDLTVKISDFGLSHNLENDDYYIIKSDDNKSEPIPVPIRWMSPESLWDFKNDLKFSTSSDIWSYGVVLWEIVTLGELPYPGVINNEDVIALIKNGTTMKMPKDCPQFMWSIISLCWLSSNQRPSFKDIVEMLLPLRDKRFDKVSYYFEKMKSVESRLCASLSENSCDPLLTDDNELRLFDGHSINESYPENYINGRHRNGEEMKFISRNSGIHDKLNDASVRETLNEISVFIVENDD